MAKPAPQLDTATQEQNKQTCPDPIGKKERSHERLNDETPYEMATAYRNKHRTNVRPKRASHQALRHNENKERQHGVKHGGTGQSSAILSLPTNASRSKKEGLCKWEVKSGCTKSETTVANRRTKRCAHEWQQTEFTAWCVNAYACVCKETREHLNYTKEMLAMVNVATTHLHENFYSQGMGSPPHPRPNHNTTH